MYKFIVENEKKTFIHESLSAGRQKEQFKNYV